MLTAAVFLGHWLHYYDVMPFFSYIPSLNLISSLLFTVHALKKSPNFSLMIKKKTNHTKICEPRSEKRAIMAIIKPKIQTIGYTQWQIQIIIFNNDRRVN